MRWIGLTGSIGAGKSTVANMLRRSGFAVIDADSLAHEGLKAGTSTYQTIVAKFGTKILDASGEIQRRELGKLIFGQPALRSWLESILHPAVQEKVKELRKKLELEGYALVFYEVPLLFEKSLENQFDKVIVVWVSDKIQTQRLQERNAWTVEEISQRNSSQIPVAEKIRRADFAINNDGTLEDLQLKVNDLIKRLSN